jgi:hypothetical protein
VVMMVCTNETCTCGMMARPPSCVLRLRMRTVKGIMVSIGVLYARKHTLSVGGTMTVRGCKMQIPHLRRERCKVEGGEG